MELIGTTRHKLQPFTLPSRENPGIESDVKSDGFDLVSHWAAIIIIITVSYFSK
jgi:hypothetical protein